MSAHGPDSAHGSPPNGPEQVPVATALYDQAFFANQTGSVLSARLILPTVFEIVRPRTMVDVGCGIGAWASVGKELGCVVAGLDGDWVPSDRLLLRPEEFSVMDLASPPSALSRAFDLAVCMEVAEHLPARVAERFVGFLASSAPAVLFSAAIPHQGGTGHVNERYPSYWTGLFESHGFEALDVVRPRHWFDRRIEIHYRQNAILFAARHKVAGFLERSGALAGQPLDMIHPEALPAIAQNWMVSIGTEKGVGILFRTIRASIRRRLPSWVAPRTFRLPR